MRSMDMTCDSGGRGGRGGWVSGDAGAETEVTLFSGPTDSLSSFLSPPPPLPLPLTTRAQEGVRQLGRQYICRHWEGPAARVELLRWQVCRSFESPSVLSIVAIIAERVGSRWSDILHFLNAYIGLIWNRSASSNACSLGRPTLKCSEIREKTRAFRSWTR